MNLFKFSPALALAVIAVGCGSKKENSSLDITPRDTMTLSLASSLKSKKVMIDSAEVDLAMNAMGKINWTVTTDIQLVDFFPKTEMSFSGEFLASYDDVSFSTYKSLPVTGQHNVEKYVRFNKIMDMQDGNILLSFEHLSTGISGQAQIREGRNGLVEIVTVTMNAQRPVAVKIKDEKAPEAWYQDADGIWQYGAKKAIGMITGGLVTLNNVK